jgi:hypothetical protein
MSEPVIKHLGWAGEGSERVPVYGIRESATDEELLEAFGSASSFLSEFGESEDYEPLKEAILKRMK